MSRKVVKYTYAPVRKKRSGGAKAVLSVCIAVLFIFALLAVALWWRGRGKSVPHEEAASVGDSSFTVPEYTGESYVEINGNVPFFRESDLTAEPFEDYSPLDSLGRCGPATACLCLETMPEEERGEIGSVRPSGWHTVRYDDLIDDGYLYNRCHLIAFVLAGENDNPLNLITGTDYFNDEGMLPFELQTARHIWENGGHVLYRVTPVFVGDELVARGVVIEAESVEDRGEGLRFCVYVFNVQPGVRIDYRTGDSDRGVPEG